MSYNIKEVMKSLNKEQASGVVSRAENILVLAGAGTGKTKVLTSRISYLFDIGVNPSSIFAVTFTNKASREMKERIKKMIPSNIKIDDAWIGTFHSLCNKIIRVHHDLLGLPKNYQTLDSDDQKSIVRRSIEEIEQELGEKLDKKEYIKDTLHLIHKAKERGLRPEKAHDLLITLNLTSTHMFIYSRYEYIKKTSNAIDFADMILCVVELFAKHPEVKKFYNNKFKHILVDEFQDTDVLQYKLIESLSENGNYLFVVGDDDQSIYGWRGAEIDNILGFSNKRKNTEIVKLEQNYRSTKNILSASNSIIGNNKTRHGKSLWSAGEEGSKIVVRGFDSPESEADFVSNEIQDRIKEGVNPSDIAILYRNNSISRSFEMKLKMKQVPYQIVGGLSFWARKEVKDLLAYLSLIANPDNDVAFERVVNFPTRGVGKKKIEQIRVSATKDNKSLFQTLSEMLKRNEFKGKTANELRLFEDIIKRAKNSDISKSIHNSLLYIIEETRIVSAYEKDGVEIFEERSANIQELTYAAKNFSHNETDEELSDIDIFLSQAALQIESENSKDVDKVVLMTTHASKGLEYKYVYIAGFERNIFPSMKAIENGDCEEERRLAYVAITRAELELVITYSTFRYNNSTGRSMFLSELKGSYLDDDYHSNGFNDNPYKRNNDFNSSINTSSSNNSKLKVGGEYNHSKFGEGTIISINEKDDSYYINIDFGFIGRKCIILKKK
jgi:DNA helicase-2/ATP-dependent DNA helicase PcrA